MQEIGFDMPVSTGVQRISAAAGAIAMLGGSSVVWAFDPSQTHFLPVCPLFALTGLACPGCGLTRGVHAFFHGDVLAALGFNALLPIWLAVFGYLFVSLVFSATRGRGLPWRFVSPAMLFGFLALMIGFGVIRNLPYYPLSVLFP